MTFPVDTIDLAFFVAEPPAFIHCCYCCLVSSVLWWRPTTTALSHTLTRHHTTRLGTFSRVHGVVEVFGPPSTWVNFERCATTFKFSCHLLTVDIEGIPVNFCQFRGIIHLKRRILWRILHRLIYKNYLSEQVKTCWKEAQLSPIGMLSLGPSENFSYG